MAWWPRRLQSPTRQSPGNCGEKRLAVGVVGSGNGKRRPLSELTCDSGWHVVEDIPELDSPSRFSSPVSPTFPMPMASAPGHPSRQDNQSTSSNHSSSQRNERGGRSHTHRPAVESAVTRLLVSIKLLLEALSLWSTQRMTETDVSDVYVRLGNDFNAAVAAFGQFGIEMTELLNVPDDLRGELEQCLSEDATPSNLEVYLPRIREIITDLLQGLRNKQTMFKVLEKQRVENERERRGTRSSRTDSRVSRTDSDNTRLSRSQHVRSAAGSEDTTGRSSVEGQPQPGRRTASGRHAHSSSTSSRPSSRADDHPVQPQPPPPPLPSDRPHVNGEGSTVPSDSNRSSLSRRRPAVQLTDAPEAPEPDVDASKSSNVTQAPLNALVSPEVKRYSLVDNPMPPTPTPAPAPALVVAEATPPNSEDNIAAAAMDSPTSAPSPAAPDTPPIDASQAPAMASSLAALKGSDVLERRASKRFSSYNISKITGGGIRERLGFGRGNNRRSMAVDSSNLTPGDLNVLTEEDETGGSWTSITRADSGSKSRPINGSLSRKVSEEEPPVPPVPEVPKDIDKFPSPTPEKKATTSQTTAGPSKQADRPSSSTLTVFLQVGREVKKASIEPGQSFSSLRVLFMDKFSYNPGQDNFPSIYIRDPSSGVMYELEDVEEVKDKCLLSLNIEPLDQIKQHIDLQMNSLSQELRELRSIVSSNTRRLSHQPPIVAQPFNDATPVARPSDKQFQRVARRLSRLVTDDQTAGSGGSTVTPQTTGSTLIPQMTGASVLSETSGRIVADLKSQFDEVQNLRRDLGVMKQLYTDFISQTKESLSTLRTQTQNVKQIANAKIGGDRAYVNAGKQSLDTRSQNVLTKIEDLQDTVENLKDDVLKRFVSPRSNILKTVSKDIAEVSTELESLKEYMTTIKPMWKKTWEAELQNIVEEQQFLTHQEEFLSDLLEDHKALTEVFGHVEKVISIRSSGQVKARGYRPPPPEEGHNGLTTVMMEIRQASINPEKRLKAIAQNQKQREKEKAARTDEFESELKGFVSGKKLKMTGGAEEIERVRQKKNDMTLKAMFTGDSNMSTGGADGS